MSGRRGRAELVSCVSCGRRVPRNKGVVYEKRTLYSTDTKDENEVRFFDTSKVYYCISCGKHRGIFEKKKRQAMQKYNR